MSLRDDRANKKARIKCNNPGHGSIGPFKERAMRPTFVDPGHHITPALVSIGLVSETVDFVEGSIECLRASPALFIGERLKSPRGSFNH